MKITRKLLPLLAAVQLAMAGAGTAQAAYLSVGYFNGGGDVTAGPVATSTSWTSRKSPTSTIRSV